MTEGSPEVAHLLSRSAQELRRCRDVVVQLEDTVHALIDSGGQGLGSGPLAKLQSIDLLDQRLNDLVLWLEALAMAVPDCRASRSAGDLAAGLRLAEMRQALAGSSDVPAGTPGATEMF